MQLGKDVSYFTKELETYKCKCSELAIGLEKKENHNKAVESKLEELQGNKVLSDKFVTQMEKSCKGMKERIYYLEDALNKTNRVKEEALNVLNAKISDLMVGKGRIEYELDVQKGRCKMLEAQLKEFGRVVSDMNKEMEIYRTKCSNLFRGLEEKVKEKTVVVANLEELEANMIALKGELKKNELACNEQKEIIAQMEKDYNVSKEQEKWAAEMIAFLEEELDKTNNDNKEVVIKLTAENSELKYGKREVQDELEVQKKRCRELSIALEKEKQKKGFEAKMEELEASKMSCDELKGVVARLEEDCKTAIEREKMVVKRNLFLEVELHKISNAKDEVIVKLNADISELECAKERVEDELEAQMERFKELEARIMKLRIEVIELISELTPNAVLDFEVETEAINRKRKNDAGEQTKIQNINHGLLELKVKEKTGSCDEMVLDSADVDSHCSFPDMVSGGVEQIKGPTSVDLLFSNLDRVKEHKISKPDSDMENRSRRKMVILSTGATYRKLASPKMDFENATGVGDSEKKLVVPPKKKNLDIIVRTKSSNQKGKGDRHSSVLPLKRKRILKIVCSDSDDDDHINLAEQLESKSKEDVVYLFVMDDDKPMASRERDMNLVPVADDSIHSNNGATSKPSSSPATSSHTG
ncbi:hypothetical protein FRX31_026482 [Thalictrum thalictroides]|uniref:Uncharacterized protein n=1 Tax=Thalictrum thalictroides TaxID=46969 RepID=A0A7J6VIB0_THATH|nr:hypothetical protein FRX31_026482 [Thalictrum thalictroides]